MKAKTFFMLAIVLMVCFVARDRVCAGQFGPARGLVLDADTGQGIEGAKIAIERPVGNKVEVESGTTAADGKYKFDTAIAVTGMAGSFNFLNPLAGKEIGSTTFYSATALTSEFPVKGYQSLFFYTQVFPVKVEKEGYKPFVGDVMSYDYNASFKAGWAGTRAGSAVLDDIVLAKEGTDKDSTVVGKYLVLTDLIIEPTSASIGETITISTKFNMAPDMKRYTGKLAVVTQMDKKVIKVDLKDDGENVDKQAGDSIYTGQLKIDKKAKSGDYKIYVYADGRPRGKRNQDTFGLPGKQMGARNILEGDFSVK